MEPIGKSMAEVANKLTSMNEGAITELAEKFANRRVFNRLKHFRAIAARYDKLARNFLAGVQLASAIILLN